MTGPGTTGLVGAATPPMPRKLAARSNFAGKGSQSHRSRLTASSNACRTFGRVARTTALMVVITR